MIISWRPNSQGMPWLTLSIIWKVLQIWEPLRGLEAQLTDPLENGNTLQPFQSCKVKHGHTTLTHLGLDKMLSDWKHNFFVIFWYPNLFTGLLIFHSDAFMRVSLKVNQHLFERCSVWPGNKPSNTWTNDDKYVGCHMASLGHIMNYT